jgi:hypothetical protein
MSIMELGALGEFFGAIAVVVTLIYLAGQLRQNTKALRSASYEHWNQISASFTDFYARHAGELSEIELHTSVSQLTPQQGKIQMALGIKTIDQAQTAFLHHRAGTLDDDVFDARISSFLTFMGENALLRQAWASGLRSYPTVAFRDFIEGRVTGLKPVDA